MNIIEIGANDGSHTMDFYRNSNVWCFEPNPVYANLLRNKFSKNKNVSVLEMAVSDFNGTANFNISSDGLSSSLNELTEFSIKNTKIKYNNKIEVNVVRMDTFLMENNIQIIDYLHCDAQGEDLKILKSFGNFISIIKKGKIEVTLKDELFSNTSNHIDDVVHFLNINEFEIINWREIDMNRKDIYRYDGNVEFCKKNTKNLI
jgi:FkbM family methyltransferase